MVSVSGVTLEQWGAMLDVQEICIEYGDDISVWIRQELDIVRDKYNSFKRENINPPIEIAMKAYPVTFNPDRKTLLRAGILEETELLIYTPMASWITEGILYDDIDMIRTTMTVQGSKYQIKEKARSSQFKNSFLYITFGLKCLP